MNREGGPEEKEVTRIRHQDRCAVSSSTGHRYKEEDERKRRGGR